MKMYDIRLDSVNLFYQLTCGPTRTKAMAVEQERLCPMQALLEEVSNPDQMRTRGIGITTISDIALPPICLCYLTDTLYDTTMRTPIGSDINLKYLRHRQYEYAITSQRTRRTQRM